MKTVIKTVTIIIVILSFNQSNAQDSTTIKRYIYEKGDPNGIGKWYMGREIAYVMGFEGIGWLERPEREAEENTSKLIANMVIKVNDTIADIGAGSGYHVLKMAPIAKNGFIYGVDIQEEMLTAILMSKDYYGSKNIDAVKGSEKSINLPKNSINKALLVDVYHEFNYPYEMIASIKEALKPNGQLFLIEYRGEDNTVPIKKVHKMTEEQAVKEMQAAGMKLLNNLDNLPWQHCMIFVKE